MKALLPLAKLLLIALLLFACFMRFNLAALHRDQSDVPSSFFETQGPMQAIVKSRLTKTNQQIARCNALMLVSVLILTGIAVYEHKRPANQAQ